MGARGERLTALFCGSQDWRDERIIFACMWGLYEIIDNMEDGLTIIHTDDRGAGQLAGRCAKKIESFNRGVLRAAELKILEYPIDPSQFTPVLGYARNQKMLEDNNPDLLFAFVPDIAASPGTAHVLELAKEREIPSYLIQRYC